MFQKRHLFDGLPPSGRKNFLQLQPKGSLECKQSVNINSNSIMEAVKSEPPTAKRVVLPNYIAANIRFLRKQRSLSQAELAEAVGLNRGNIASYEAGQAEPRICSLLRISKLFGVSSHDLTRLDLSDPENLAKAEAVFSELVDDKRRVIESFTRELEDLEKLLEGIERCFTHKFNSIEEPNREVLTLSFFFEQYQEATQQLLSQHQELLHMAQCRCK